MVSGNPCEMVIRPQGITTFRLSTTRLDGGFTRVPQRAPFFKSKHHWSWTPNFSSKDWTSYLPVTFLFIKWAKSCFCCCYLGFFQVPGFLALPWNSSPARDFSKFLCLEDVVFSGLRLLFGLILNACNHFSWALWIFSTLSMLLNTTKHKFTNKLGVSGVSLPTLGVFFSGLERIDWWTSSNILP